MNVAAAVPRGELLHHEPMARHTSWRVGGPADCYFEPADRSDLLAFVQALPADERLLWIGLGSNLLVRDGGVRGTVIGLHGCLDSLRLEDDGAIYAESGVHCARLAKFSVQQGLGGGAFLAGIPGTVGGALAMNAGAHGGETWPRVREVEVLYRDGRVEWIGAERFNYGYRHVRLPENFAGFLAVRFDFPSDDAEQAAIEMKDWLARRKATQPVGKPSCGSVFRNPPNDHAARLIESCGLKGYRIGGAVVSPMHANFIINEDQASAEDIERLIAHVRETVMTQTGVALEPEVRIVGEHGGAR